MRRLFAVAAALATLTALSVGCTDESGATEAVISRVRTPDDLDKLSTFDDQELDTAASRLADACR
jgi:hypothetical protein